MRWRTVIIVALLAWIASGTYIVQGDQQAVVRRFGRFVSSEDSQPELFNSGLRWDLPFPFSKVDLLNLNEVRSIQLSPGDVEADELGDALLALGTDDSTDTQFLTGDRNILNVRLSVHFRISGSGVRQYLTASQSPESRLRPLVESVAADLIASSGVDFVHPLGLGELQTAMTTSVQAAALPIGILVESVAIDQVNPPLRVKAEFLDVANAKADQSRYIETARAYGEQRLQSAKADEADYINTAETTRRRTIESARGRSKRLNQMLDRIDQSKQPTVARRMTMRRLYVEAIEEILAGVPDKVFLQSGKPVDLMLFQGTAK
ncbi:protease modulator HflK [bacterium]|nr:protease modulator HflK [bacterium]